LAVQFPAFSGHHGISVPERNREVISSLFLSELAPGA
jgi:hypothetical protein